MLWVSAARKVFPPALIGFGVKPDQVVFVDMRKARDAMWATEEALKCSAIAVVVADGNPWSRVRIDRLQTAVDAWFTSAMRGRLDTALPVHIAARAAFFLCSGPARWPSQISFP